MSASTSPPLKYTLPTFGLLSLAGFYFIVVHMAQSQAPQRWLEAHHASAVPLALTHVPLLDALLTPLVSFFVGAFGDPASPAYPTAADFVWSFGAMTQPPLVEAARTGLGAGAPLAHALMWGALYQRLSGAWVLPLWALAFMHARTRADGAGVSRVAGESVLAGCWLGFVLPAAAMLAPGGPPLTSCPLYVAAPVLMPAVVHLYFLLRRAPCPAPAASQPQPSQSDSGYAFLQATYLTVFTASCISYFHLVLIPGLRASPTPSSPARRLATLAAHLHAHFVPPHGLRTPLPTETNAASAVTHFVQWDVIVVLLALSTAGIWDLALRRPASDGAGSTSTARFVGTAAVCVFVTTLGLGPGAATAGLWAYRESVLEKARSGRAAYAKYAKLS